MLKLYNLYMIQEALWLRANRRFSSVPSEQISRDTPAARIYLITTRPTTTLWWTSRYKLDLTLLKHISLQIGSFNYTTSDHPLPLTSQIRWKISLLHLLLILLSNQYVSRSSTSIVAYFKCTWQCLAISLCTLLCAAVCSAAASVYIHMYKYVNSKLIYTRRRKKTLVYIYGKHSWKKTIQNKLFQHFHWNVRKLYVFRSAKSSIRALNYFSMQICAGPRISYRKMGFYKQA